MATMHPQDANELNKRGGTILCLDVPPGTTFGLDCMSWTTGDRFKGVKMIPPGVHYVWCRYDMLISIGVMRTHSTRLPALHLKMRWDSFCTSNLGRCALSCSFFSSCVCFSLVIGEQVAVRRWQSQTESLAEVDHDEERQFSEGMPYCRLLRRLVFTLLCARCQTLCF